jgi:hypothetical protein
VQEREKLFYSPDDFNSRRLPHFFPPVMPGTAGPGVRKNSFDQVVFTIVTKIELRP